ncbi:MAG: FKBP-type peptidyl-prolyl cis-trans isomerase [Bacteroidales bacterium]|nr:FKBP-type peptidyl-prolyl cis-trans isomerase [Bacteroidales bacterium]
MNIEYRISNIEFRRERRIILPTILIILFISTLLFACSDKNSKQEKEHIDPKALKEPLIEANKDLVEAEEEQINDYITRYKWKMKLTESGLRYLIYKKTDREQASNEKLAKINYKVELLNGELCYSSEIDGPKEFVIGGGEVESGLNEAILLLKIGEKAKFIIPSHLAFGLTGDKDKIPLRASLIYDIELLELR